MAAIFEGKAHRRFWKLDIILKQNQILGWSFSIISTHWALTTNAVLISIGVLVLSSQKHMCIFTSSLIKKVKYLKIYLKVIWILQNNVVVFSLQAICWPNFIKLWSCTPIIQDHFRFRTFLPHNVIVLLLSLCWFLKWHVYDIGRSGKVYHISCALLLIPRNSIKYMPQFDGFVQTKSALKEGKTTRYQKILPLYSIYIHLAQLKMITDISKSSTEIGQTKLQTGRKKSEMISRMIFSLSRLHFDSNFQANVLQYNIRNHCCQCPLLQLGSFLTSRTAPASLREIKCFIHASC